MRILFATLPSTVSHINSISGFARALGAEGHTVAWLAMTNGQKELLSARGIVAVRTDETSPDLDTEVAAKGKDAYERRHAPEPSKEERDIFRGIYITPIYTMVDSIRRAIREFAPDVMVINLHTYAAQVAAHVEEVPYLGVSPQLLLCAPPTLKLRMLEVFAVLADEREEAYRRYGVELTFRGIEALSPYHNICMGSRSFVGQDHSPPRSVSVVPPFLQHAPPEGEANGFPWKKLKQDKPLVLASLGSTWWALRPDLFPLIGEALRSLDVCTVICAGGFAETAEARQLPENVITVSFGPQRALLEKATAFISHCGAASVNEAMFNGVPVLGLPIELDQPVQAHFIEKAGVGFFLNPDALDVTTLRRGVIKLLASDTCRSRAAEVMAECRDPAGLQQAVGLLTRLAGT